MCDEMSSLFSKHGRGKHVEINQVTKWEGDHIFHVHVLFIKSTSGVTNGILFIYTPRLIGCLYCV